MISPGRGRHGPMRSSRQVQATTKKAVDHSLRTINGSPIFNYKSSAHQTTVTPTRWSMAGLTGGTCGTILQTVRAMPWSIPCSGALTGHHCRPAFWEVWTAAASWQYRPQLPLHQRFWVRRY